MFRIRIEQIFRECWNLITPGAHAFDVTLAWHIRLQHQDGRRALGWARGSANDRKDADPAEVSDVSGIDDRDGLNEQLRQCLFPSGLYIKKASSSKDGMHSTKRPGSARGLFSGRRCFGTDRPFCVYTSLSGYWRV